jgi:hypothetical protein
LGFWGFSAEFRASRRDWGIFCIPRRNSPKSFQDIQMRKIAQAGLGIVALALAAPAHADVPWIAPFVGSWSAAHSNGLNIQSDGTGRWTYPDRRTCPHFPFQPDGCGVTGTTDFTLTSLDPVGNADGTVTASTDPTDGAAVGSSMVIGHFSPGETPWSHGTGTVLWVNMGKLRGTNFCNQTSAHQCGD